MKTAIYNPGAGAEHWPLNVVKENKNGTVDLANDEGVVKVTNCPKCDGPKEGHCKVEGDEAPAPAKDKTPKAPKQPKEAAPAKDKTPKAPKQPKEAAPTKGKTPKQPKAPAETEVPDAAAALVRTPEKPAE